MRELLTQKANTDRCPGIQDGHALLDLSRGWLKHGNPVVALELLKTAISSREADGDRDLRAKVLKETGRAYMMQSDWTQAESFYLEAQRLFTDEKNFRGAAECARNRANMHFQQGNYQVSEQLCEQAIEWASEINDYALRATISNTLGAIKSATGDLRESISIFRLCLADFESSGNVVRRGYVLLNIGLTQTELGEHVEALSSLNEALAIAFSEKDTHLVEICYQNISKCYLAQNEITLARSVVDTARRILPGLNSKALAAELDLIDGRILRLMSDFNGAADVLERTLHTAVENNLTALEADTLREQAELEKARGNFDPAAAKWKAAAAQYKRIGMDKGYKDAIQALKNLARTPHA